MELVFRSRYEVGKCPEQAITIPYYSLQCTRVTENVIWWSSWNTAWSHKPQIELVALLPLPLFIYGIVFHVGVLRWLQLSVVAREICDSRFGLGSGRWSYLLLSPTVDCSSVFLFGCTSGLLRVLWFLCRLLPQLRFKVSGSGKLAFARSLWNVIQGQILAIKLSQSVDFFKSCNAHPNRPWIECY